MKTETKCSSANESYIICGLIALAVLALGLVALSVYLGKTVSDQVSSIPQLVIGVLGGYLGNQLRHALTEREKQAQLPRVETQDVADSP